MNALQHRASQNGLQILLLTWHPENYGGQGAVETALNSSTVIESHLSASHGEADEIGRLDNQKNEALKDLLTSTEISQLYE